MADDLYLTRQSGITPPSFLWYSWPRRQPEGGPSGYSHVAPLPSEDWRGREDGGGEEVRSGRELSHTQQQFRAGPIARGTRPLAPCAPPQPGQRQHSGNNVHLTSAFWAPEFAQRRNKPHPDSVSADGRWVCPGAASARWPYTGLAVATFPPKSLSSSQEAGQQRHPGPGSPPAPCCLVLHGKHGQPKAGQLLATWW